jgi:serine/threonine protein kinase
MPKSKIHRSTAPSASIFQEAVITTMGAGEKNYSIKEMVQEATGASAATTPASFFESRKRKYRVDPYATLGEGTYHIARHLGVPRGEDPAPALVSIKPKQEWIPAQKISKIKKEADAFKIFNQAYPHLDASFHVFRHRESGAVTYRAVMPDFGETLGDYVCDASVSNLDKVAILLKAAEELQRLHIEVGHVHGDLKSNNIAVMHTPAGMKVVYFDLEFSTPIARFRIGIRHKEYPMARCCYYRQGENIEVSYIAPERKVLAGTPQSRLPYSLPNQDVYSFGYMLLEMLKHKDCPALASSQEVMQWIKSAMESDPLKRPSLATGIQALEDLKKKLGNSQQDLKEEACDSQQAHSLVSLKLKG